MFIERKFIPEHVEKKTASGRTHYQAILKHILRPETVERLFAPYVGIAKARLRAVPDWPYLDNVRLCDLTSDHARQLVSSASARGYSPQTVKHIRNVISAIIAHAKRERMFNGDNPITAVESPPITRKKSHDLTIEQAKTMLKLMHYPEREIALIMISTGMSASEICALQWKHINPTQTTICSDGQLIPPRSVSIRKTWCVDAVVDVNTLKRRDLGLPELLIIKLKRRRNITNPDDFVFTTPSGSPLRPANLKMSRLKPIGRELDMPWLSWQVLRRAHDALVSELIVKLTNDLVLNAR